MWSKKPTPVAICCGAWWSRASATVTSVSPVLRLSSALRLISGILTGRHRFGVHGEALGLGDRDPGRGDRARGAAHPDLAHAAAEVRDGDPGREARRAVGRE